MLLSPSLQTFKNALSPYRLGGSSGGSDFDPNGKTDSEVFYLILCNIPRDEFTCSLYPFLFLKINLLDHEVLSEFHERVVSIFGA